MIENPLPPDDAREPEISEEQAAAEAEQQVKRAALLSGLAIFSAVDYYSPARRRERLFQEWQNNYIEQVRQSDPRYQSIPQENESAAAFKKREKEAKDKFAQEAREQVAQVAQTLVETHRDALFDPVGGKDREAQVSELLQNNPELANLRMGGSLAGAATQTDSALQKKHQEIISARGMSKSLPRIKASEDARFVLNTYRANHSQRQSTNKSLLQHADLIEQLIARHMAAAETENLMQKVWQDYQKIRTKPSLVARVLRRQPTLSTDEQVEFNHFLNTYAKNAILNKRIQREYRTENNDKPSYLRPLPKQSKKQTVPTATITVEPQTVNRTVYSVPQEREEPESTASESESPVSTLTNRFLNNQFSSFMEKSMPQAMEGVGSFMQTAGSLLGKIPGLGGIFGGGGAAAATTAAAGTAGAAATGAATAGAGAAGAAAATAPVTIPILAIVLVAVVGVAILAFFLDFTNASAAVTQPYVFTTPALSPTPSGLQTEADTDIAACTTADLEAFLSPPGAIATGYEGVPQTDGQIKNYAQSSAYSLPYRNPTCPITQNAVQKAYERMCGEYDPQTKTCHAKPGSGVALPFYSNVIREPRLLYDWQIVADNAARYNLNPLFVVALWIEESAGGGAEATQFGCDYKNGKGLEYTSTTCEQMACLSGITTAEAQKYNKFACLYKFGINSGQWNEETQQCAGNPSFTEIVEFWYSYMLEAMKTEGVSVPQSCEIVNCPDAPGCPQTPEEAE